MSITRAHVVNCLAILLFIYYLALSLICVITLFAVNRGNSSFADKLMAVNVISFIFISPFTVIYMGKAFKNYLFVAGAIFCLLAPISIAGLVNVFI